MDIVGIYKIHMKSNQKSIQGNGVYFDVVSDGYTIALLGLDLLALESSGHKAYVVNNAKWVAGHAVILVQNDEPKEWVDGWLLDNPGYVLVGALDDLIRNSAQVAYNEIRDIVKSYEGYAHDRLALIEEVIDRLEN